MVNIRHSFHDKNLVSGFSLVELSIVLVILGLLTGGILAGQSLIKAAELRSVTTQTQQFMTMAQTFRSKYLAIPGDMRNAQRFWGHSNACGGSDPNGVCNGNGDGNIALGTPAVMYPEAFQFWRHASKAGMVEGSYTGTGLDGEASKAVGGINAPTAKYNNGVWVTRTTNINHPVFYFSGIPDSTVLVVGPENNGWPQGEYLTPEDAWNLDTKVDDGKPALGNFLSPAWQNCTDAANRDDTDADYELTNTSISCIVKIRGVF